MIFSLFYFITVVTMSQNIEIPPLPQIPQVSQHTISYNWIETLDSKSYKNYYYKQIPGETQLNFPLQFHLPSPPVPTPTFSITISSQLSSDSNTSETVDGSDTSVTP